MSVEQVSQRDDHGRFFGLVAVAIVLTNARFLTDLAVIGPHLLVALWLLLLLALLAETKPPSTIARPILIGAVALALGASRPEGALLVVLAALPHLVRQSDPQRRLHHVRAAAFAVFAWQLAHRTDGLTTVPQLDGFAMIALTVALATMTVPVIARLVGRVPAVGLAIAGAWVALLIVLLLHPDAVIRSLIATVANVALDVGGWGVGFLLLAALAILVRLLSRRPLPLRAGLLVSAFLPVHLMLPVLASASGDSYRIGQSDSLNRMLFHIFPLLVVAVSIAVLRASRDVTDAAALSAPTDEADPKL
jgi:hypothetical protein